MGFLLVTFVFIYNSRLPNEQVLVLNVCTSLSCCHIHSAFDKRFIRRPDGRISTEVMKDLALSSLVLDVVN